MRKKKKFEVRTLVEYFNFEVLTSSPKSLTRAIEVPEINRPALELAGFFVCSEPDRLLAIGNKELAFIKDVSHEVMRSRLLKLFSEKSPALIICQGRECPQVILDVANEINYPILRTNSRTVETLGALFGYLLEALGPKATRHGTFVSVFGRGVLLIGSSGLGKSEIALELIRHGHLLVADDAVLFNKVGQALYGMVSQEIFYGILEVRGIGLVDIQRLHGVTSVKPKMKLDYVINLERIESTVSFERLGDNPNQTWELLGIKVPQLTIPVSGGRNMVSIVETAITNMILKESGHDTGALIIQAIDEQLLKG